MGKVAAFPEVTLNTLEESSKGPVWVVNETEAPLRGQLVISITGAGGRPGQVVVPLTWIPINLTGQAPRSQLLESNHFRSAVTKRQIRLVSEEEAKAMLARPGGKEENANVANFSLNAIYEARGTAPSSDEGFEKADLPEQSISHQVFSLIETMAANDELAVLNTMRNMGKKTKDEYRAIYVRAKELRYSKVKDLAKEMAGNK